MPRSPCRATVTTLPRFTASPQCQPRFAANRPSRDPRYHFVEGGIAFGTPEQSPGAAYPAPRSVRGANPMHAMRCGVFVPVLTLPWSFSAPDACCSLQHSEGMMRYMQHNFAGGVDGRTGCATVDIACWHREGGIKSRSHWLARLHLLPCAMLAGTANLTPARDCCCHSP